MTGEELKAWRERNDQMSRDELARLLEITATTIYRWETDTKHTRKIPPYLKLALQQIESDRKQN